ncbi:MAG TPA: hypothetical protein PLY87_23475 [Planctomycetaceae bacterium]|nr:hypothetical protein [Planctomycetaceae bacterium]HQZ68080.1 hypothetical protein [Planctomycetaceae bacterium]HRA88274.1 hypothetical protein [Planctomycetaceae bacterium]
MNTFKADLPANLQAGALELVLLWLSGEHTGLSFDDAHNLEVWLCSTSDETELNHCLGDALLATLTCLAEIRQRTPDEQIQNGERGLQDWASAVMRLVDLVSPDCKDWSHALGAACEKGDRLLISLLGVAIAQAGEQFSMPTAIRKIVDKASCAGRKWCEKMPVPPAPNRSMLAADYFYGGRNEGDNARLKSLAARLAKQDDQLLQQFFGESHPDGRSGRLDEDDLIIALEDLSSVVNQCVHGWPMEVSRLAGPLERLQRHLDTVTDDLAEVSGDVAPLGKALRQLEACLAASRQPVAVNSAANPESLNAVSNAAVLLKELAHWLTTRTAAFYARYSGIFSDLIPEAEQSNGDISTPLLDLLIGLNSELSEPSSHQEELRSMRDRIHKILQTQNLIVLDDALVGKPLSAVRKHVTVFRSYPSSSIPSDHVISVRQPGYLLQSGADSCLIRPAEVNISR